MPASIGTYTDPQGRPRSMADDILGERMRLINADLMRRGWTQNASGQWIAPTERVEGLPPIHSPASYAQISQALAGNSPVPTGTVGAASTTTSATTAPAPFVAPMQTAQPTVAQLPSGPSEVQNVQQRPSPLMQLFNFPRLRTKKPAQATVGAAPGGVGRYNENFWNAWRL